MKLSAPPPPPPPPSDETPSPPPDETPGADAPGSPETPEAPPAPPAPKPLAWPAWYAGIDATLVGLVLVFTFAAASFVAHNSDVWLHLAAGKRLFAGQYTPGSDPFSYSAADRAWVNHSWLLDALASLLYGGKGVVLVVAKALAITLAFGLLIAIRRPQFPLWPWAGVACVAVLAAAPRFTLDPLVASILFLSVTMYLLFRMPQKANSWRFPIAIGVTFWLWANCDQWFFVGPLALALVILGNLIQTKLLNVPEEAPADGAEEEPLGRLPDTMTLARALGIGVLACMLTPNHVRVWELPVELTKPAGFETDPRLRDLLHSPIDSQYLNSADLGYNVNGLAFAVLFVGGAAVLGFGSGRVRPAHIVLWIGFAALGLASVYAIPFLAVVAVPLVASQLNASGPRELGAWDDPRSRLLWIGSSAGRIASVLAICALGVAAYPGWMHPEPSNPALVRRVAWGVEPEPATVRAAEEFKAWRESGKLPADARGFVANTELANYLAWFAPQEKVFVNARYNHHRRELPDYLAVRKALGLIEVKDEAPKPADATAVFAKVGAEFVAVHGAPSDPPELQRRVNRAVVLLYREPAEWSPWYLDGRTTVFGWRAAGGPAFAALRVDPVVLAFGPKVVPNPDPEVTPPLVPLGWEEPFVRPTKAAPLDAGLARAWLRFKEAPTERQARREVVREWVRQEVAPLLFFRGVPATTDATAHGFATTVALATGNVRFAFKPSADLAATADTMELRAAPLLALRAARRAIAEAPDHPDGYFSLALALDDALLPLTDSERALGRVAALRQCLDRLPKPDRYKRGQFAAPASEVAFQLATVYHGRKLGPVNPNTGQLARDPKTGQELLKGFAGMPVSAAPLNLILGQAVIEDGRGNFQRQPVRALRPDLRASAPAFFLPLDAAYDAVELGLQYLPADTVGDTPDEAKRRADRFAALHEQLKAAVIKAKERYGQERGADVPRSVDAAVRNSLPGTALQQLTESADLGKDFKERVAEGAILRVCLELALGRVEDAHGSLTSLAQPESAASLDKAGLSGLMQLLKYQKSLQAGEYKAAGELWNAISGRGMGELSKLPPLGPTVPRPIVLGTIAAVRRAQSTQEAEKALAQLLAPPLVPLSPYARALATEIWQGSWAEVAGVIQRQIVEQMQSEANYYGQRGALALLEGDVPAARRWFQQARREPPAGWGLGPEFPQQAGMYLRLIDLAATRAATP